MHRIDYRKKKTLELLNTLRLNVMQKNETKSKEDD